jgi:hypothetical protein
MERCPESGTRRSVAAGSSTIPVLMNPSDATFRAYRFL